MSLQEYLWWLMPKKVASDFDDQCLKCDAGSVPFWSANVLCILEPIPLYLVSLVCRTYMLPKHVRCMNAPRMVSLYKITKWDNFGEYDYKMWNIVLTANCYILIRKCYILISKILNDTSFFQSQPDPWKRSLSYCRLRKIDYRLMEHCKTKCLFFQLAFLESLLLFPHDHPPAL